MRTKMLFCTALVFVTAQFNAHKCIAQAMQEGISVRLPVTSNAVPMPDADKQDSLIVTVTDDGSVYCGVTPITPAALVQKIRDDLSHQTTKKLYIKADTRTPYANVAEVLDAARMASVDALILLTAQRDSAEPATLVPPKGLEVLVGAPLASISQNVVQVLNSGQQWPTLKINNKDVPWASLQSKLKQVFQDQREKVVLVKAEGQLPFAQVAQVIDICRSTGAKVVLVTPGLYAGLTTPPGNLLSL